MAKELKIAKQDDLILQRARMANATIGTAALTAAENTAIVNLEASVFEIGDEFDIPTMEQLDNLLVCQNTNGGGKTFYCPVILKDGNSKQFYFNSLKKSVSQYHETAPGRFEVIRDANGKADVKKPTTPDGIATYNMAMSHSNMASLIKDVAGKHVKVVEKIANINGPRLEMNEAGNWNVVGLSKTTVMGFKIS